jgi:hypothetical protein
MTRFRQQLPESITAKRTDPVYMAHAYLTKIPVAGITPFIEAFTEPGQVVLDPFAGSGMTGWPRRSWGGGPGCSTSPSWAVTSAPTT